MDWYALDEANKKDGHYRRKPLEISSLEVELESAVAALRQAEKRIAELEAENNRLAELLLLFHIEWQNQLHHGVEDKNYD